jgi:hypothetical protein
MSNIYTAGLNNVGTYQVSGAPFAIDPSSTVVEFPFVTIWVKIVNNGSSDRKVGFSANGVGGTDYFIVRAESETECLKLKLTELHFDSASDLTVVAGLSNLPVSRVNNISVDGTNWSGSVGVG